jgi:DNA modification methylase
LGFNSITRAFLPVVSHAISVDPLPLKTSRTTSPASLEFPIARSANSTNEVSVWDVKREAKNEFHPTQKPVELAERAIGNSSEAGDVVLDVFSGSGSTLIACETTGRKARVMELNPNYVDVAVRRWQQFTGKRATLEATGAEFPA